MNIFQQIVAGLSTAKADVGSLQASQEQKHCLIMMDDAQVLITHDDEWAEDPQSELHTWVSGDPLPDGIKLPAQIDGVKRLIAAGHDIHERNCYGETALHACRDVEIGQVLLDAGASLEALDKEGNTPLHMAFWSEMAEFFVYNGADTKALNFDAQTPLECIRERNDDSDFAGYPEAFERGIARRKALVLAHARETAAMAMPIGSDPITAPRQRARA
jgi:hypothetical protein